jgi:hypothetical protein
MHYWRTADWTRGDCGDEVRKHIQGLRLENKTKDERLMMMSIHAVDAVDPRGCVENRKYYMKRFY